MQQDIRQMMSPRLETVELTIQHVRNGSQRMPVVRMHMGEGPLNPLEGETVRDPWILVYVLIVVVVDKLVPNGLAEDDPDNCHKDSADHAGNDPVTDRPRRRRCSRAASGSHFPSYRISHSTKRLESRELSG